MPATARHIQEERPPVAPALKSQLGQLCAFCEQYVHGDPCTPATYQNCDTYIASLQRH